MDLHLRGTLPALLLLLWFHLTTAIAAPAAEPAAGDVWLVVRRADDGHSLLIYDPDFSAPRRERRFAERIRHLAPLPDGTGAVITLDGTPGGQAVVWTSDDRLTPVPGFSGIDLRRCIAAPDGGWLAIAGLEPGSDRPEDTALIRRSPQGHGPFRVAFDLYGADDPAALDDGRVLYTRWQPGGTGLASAILTCNPDGTLATGQAAATAGGALRHPCGIPGSRRIAAIATAHPQDEWGRLVLCDPLGGQDSVMPAPGSGDQGEFSHPWPDGDRIIAAWRPDRSQRSSIVAVAADGRRTLCADPDADLTGAIRLHPGRAVFARPDLVDWRLSHGWIYIQDARLTGNDQRHAPTHLRVSVLRPASPPGTAPIRIPLGTIPLAADGSVFAQVPAREPLAFTLLGADGSVVRDMASWTTVQRGERVSCLGCHVHPDITPATGGALAFSAPPIELRLPPDLPPDPVRQGAWAAGERRRVQAMVIATYGAR